MVAPIFLSEHDIAIIKPILDAAQWHRFEDNTTYTEKTKISQFLKISPMLVAYLFSLRFRFHLGKYIITREGGMLSRSAPGMIISKADQQHKVLPYVVTKIKGGGPPNDTRR